MARRTREASEEQTKQQRQARFMATAAKALRAWQVVAAGIRKVGTTDYQVNPIDMNWALAAQEQAMAYMREGTQ